MIIIKLYFDSLTQYKYIEYQKYKYNNFYQEYLKFNFSNIIINRTLSNNINMFIYINILLKMSREEWERLSLIDLLNFYKNLKIIYTKIMYNIKD